MDGGGQAVFGIGEVVQVTVPQWLADKEGFGTRRLEGTVRVTTDKALLLETVDGDEIWLPVRWLEVE